MDKTHYRFYDRIGARELVEKSGYQIILESAEGGFPQPIIRRFYSQKIDQVAVSLFPGLFAWQFMFVAKTTLHS